MIRRAFLAAIFAALVAVPALAQTKPKTQVPAENRAQARAIVNQLLRQGKIMRSSDVKRGMKGIARSVFVGTKIEEFPIEVLGNLSRVQGGGDLVLIRVTGGTVVKRQSGIIAGMSGSPVYINGKLLGAIAIGWGFPKEPIGGVTPITQMIENALPDNERKLENRSLKPANGTAVKESYFPKSPLTIAGKRIVRVDVSRDFRPRLAMRDTPSGAIMTMRPATTLLQLSGFSQSSLPMLRKAYERYGIEPVIGPASKKGGVKPKFIPGGAVGVQLVSGDMDQTAVGTITFRWGKRILAFGHPMFGQGATSLPMTTSYIHDIFPSYQRSFKLGSPVDTVGALQQDTQYAIGGTVGAVADTIPMTVSVRDPERQIARTYRVRVMKDPALTPMLMGSVAVEAIETALGQTSDKMVRVGLRMQIDGAPTIVKHNYLYAPGSILDAALADFGQSLGITQMNEFARGSIRRVDLTVALEPVRRTARIKSLFADRNKVRAGETVRVNVILEPSDTPDKTITKTFSFPVPADAPGGVMRIAAGPASGYYALRMRVGAEPPDPTNLKELVAAYQNLGAANELLVEASTPDTFLLIDRKKVSNPSPQWSKLLRGGASTSIGSFNETMSRRETVEYSLSGSQSLSIPVESLKQDRLAEGSATPPEMPAAPISPATPAIAPDDGMRDLPEEMPGEAVLPQARFDAEKWFNSAPFPRDLKTWRKFGRTFGDNLQAAPGREPSIRPVTPSVTSPTPTPTPVPTPTPTPTPAPIEGGKSLGRPALSWVQSATADFLRGNFRGAQISSEGQILLSPPTQLLATTAETFGWSIAGDNKGNVYLGTGNGARIFKIDAGGKATILYDGPEVAVTAMTTDAAGNLYAGVSPGGRVYRFAPDGKKITVFNSGETFVWALTLRRTDDLLVGTGGEKGKLWQVLGAGTATQTIINLVSYNDRPTLIAFPLARFEQKHVRSIAVNGSDIFVGTGSDGVLYRVDKNWKTTALYQVAAAAGAESTPGKQGDSEITSVVAAPEGVYFGTLNSGTIFRWNETSGVTALYPSPQSSVFSLARAADGRVFAATGDKGIVYQITPAVNAGDVRGARILEPTQQQALALAMSPSGDLLVGTGNNAAAFRIAIGDDKSSGTFTSAIFDAKNSVTWGALRAIGNAAIETRSGNTLDPDASWSNWQSAARNDLGELRIASPAARFLQYRATLANVKGAAPPSLSRVEIVYRAKNSAPTVTFALPKGGEWWNKKKTLSWSAQDPNEDTLRYRLWLSNDDGKTWQSVALTTPTTASQEIDTTKFADGTYRARVEASDAARNPDDPQSDEIVSAPFVIDNTPPKIDSSGVRMAESGAPVILATATDALSPIVSAEWRFAPPKPAVKPATPIAPAKTPVKSAAPNTSKTAIVPAKPATPPAKSAADAASKPAVPVVTTTPPATDAPLVLAPVVPDADAGWQALAASDGIFDSRRESVVATVGAEVLEEAIAAANKAGGKLSHAIDVRVRDAADNIVIITLNAP